MRSGSQSDRASICSSSIPPGRLQNKAGLMEELAKIVRVIKKVDADRPA